jgi:plastocyanin
MNNKSVWIALVVVVLIVAGIFMVMSRSNSNPTPANNTLTDSATQAPMPTDSSSTDSAMAQGQVKEFIVEGSPFKFSPAAITVNQGDRVKVVFKNLQGMHDFVIDELNVKTEILKTPNAEETVEFVADKKGTFKYYCSVPGHRAQGMEGILTVN